MDGLVKIVIKTSTILDFAWCVATKAHLEKRKTKHRGQGDGEIKNDKTQDKRRTYY